MDSIHAAKPEGLGTTPWIQGLTRGIRLKPLRNEASEGLEIDQAAGQSSTEHRGADHFRFGAVFTGAQKFNASSVAAGKRVLPVELL